MRSVWLSSTYYLDPAVEELSGNAERMMTRALAYCGNAETSGYVSVAAIKKLGLPAPMKLAAELVTQRIFVARPGGGWEFRNWDAWQSSSESLLTRQKADRDRQARRRAAEREKRTGMSRDKSRDSHANKSRDNGSSGAVDNSVLEGEKVAKNARATGEYNDSAPHLVRAKNEVLPAKTHFMSRGQSRDNPAVEQNREEQNSTYVPDEDSRNEPRTNVKSPSDHFNDGVPLPPDPEPPTHIETGGKPKPRQATDAHRSLVRACIGNGYPRTTIDALAVRAEILIHQGVDQRHIQAGLRRWPTVANAIPAWLDNMVGDARKADNTQRQLTRREQTYIEAEALKDNPNLDVLQHFPTAQKAISDGT